MDVESFDFDDIIAVAERLAQEPDYLPRFCFRFVRAMINQWIMGNALKVLAHVEAYDPAIQECCQRVVARASLDVGYKYMALRALAHHAEGMGPDVVRETMAMLDDDLATSFTISLLSHASRIKSPPIQDAVFLCAISRPLPANLRERRRFGTGIIDLVEPNDRLCRRWVDADLPDYLRGLLMMGLIRTGKQEYSPLSPALADLAARDAQTRWFYDIFVSVYKW